jgi:aromatic-L-amino-acid decarboxylase
MATDTAAPPSTEAAARTAVLDMPPEQFRALGHQLVDTLADVLAGLTAGRVAPDTTPAAMRAALGADAPLPEEGADAGELLARAAALMAENSTFSGHPRFVGYVVSSPAPLGALAELIASVTNPNVGAWALSPLATELERQTVRWIAELLGYPAECGGLLVSGGNMANVVCCIAASRARAGWDLRARGAAAGPPLAIYASAESHTWVQKAADLMGLGTDAIRWVPVDAEYRMDVAALRGMLAKDKAAGARPFLVAAAAGSVSTGAVDPLGELADLCQAEGLWLHVDGAYGAPAAVLDDAPADLRALGRADSVAVDPHKWLYAPLEAGCVLVRDADALHRAFSFHPPYYRFEGDADDPPTNFHEWGPQNSRGFRALKVWLALRNAGRAGYVRMIGDDVRMARALFKRADEHPELQALTLGLSIATFRYVPPRLRDRIGQADAEAELNALNARVLDRVQRGGQAYPSNAVLAGGRFALRACIVNFRTTLADVEMLVEIVVGAGREVEGGA